MGNLMASLMPKKKPKSKPKARTNLIKQNDPNWFFINHYLLNLPAAVLTHLFIFAPNNTKQLITGIGRSRTLTISNQHKILEFNLAIGDKNGFARSEVEKNEKLLAFCRLIAMEAENNQNQAEAILICSRPVVTEGLISTKIKQFKDAAGREFETPISAYGYAFWAGDTRMCLMLQRHMDEETKAKVYEECETIRTNGVTFTLNEERVENSKHFDFEPIIAAYDAYLVNETSLLNTTVWSDRDSFEAETGALWLKIGKELAKVPTHVAQEYCSDIPFAPSETFVESLKTTHLVRTVKFYNYVSEDNDEELDVITVNKEFWFSTRGVNPDLGKTFCVYKCALDEDGARRCESAGAPLWMIWLDSVSMRDSWAAIIALCDKRTGDDIRLTLDNLKPTDIEQRYSF
jgi:hypothetical protein